MTKAEYRKAYKRLIQELSQDELKHRSTSLVKQLRPLLLNSKAKHIGVFMPLSDEADLRELYSELWARGKRLYLPKVLSETEMDFYAFDSFEDLVKTEPYGILEPKGEETKKIEGKDLELLLVSGLAFDQKGYRLGRGKAYYDRYLAKAPNIDTIGVDLALLDIEELVPNEWDIPLKMILKPNNKL